MALTSRWETIEEKNPGGKQSKKVQLSQLHTLKASLQAELQQVLQKCITPLPPHRFQKKAGTERANCTSGFSAAESLQAEPAWAATGSASNNKIK